MTDKEQSHLPTATIIILTLLLGVNITLLWNKFAFRVDPYTNVVALQEDRWKEDSLELTYNFIKSSSCTLTAFYKVGKDSDGKYHYLEHDNLNSLPPDANVAVFDRPEGLQTLDVEIYFGGRDIVEVEIRTEHECIIEGVITKPERLFLRTREDG